MIDHKKFEGHTPGPLIADVRSGCVAVYQRIRESDSEGLSPHQDRVLHYSSKGAFFDGSGWEMDNTAIKDAELFAAAPDLLAENIKLRELVKVQEELIDEIFGNFPSMEDAYDALFATITAAKKALE